MLSKLSIELSTIINLMSVLVQTPAAHGIAGLPEPACSSTAAAAHRQQMLLASRQVLQASAPAYDVLIALYIVRYITQNIKQAPLCLGSHWMLRH